jgi:hypothetical protein
MTVIPSFEEEEEEKINKRIFFLSDYIEFALNASKNECFKLNSLIFLF